VLAIEAGRLAGGQSLAMGATIGARR